MLELGIQGIRYVLNEIHIIVGQGQWILSVYLCCIGISFSFLAESRTLVRKSHLFEIKQALNIVQGWLCGTMLSENPRLTRRVLVSPRLAFCYL